MLIFEGKLYGKNISPRTLIGDNLIASLRLWRREHAHPFTTRKMMKFSLLILLGSTQVNAFIPQFIVQFKTSTVRLNVAPPLYEGKAQPLFAEDDDMIPVAEAYVHAKYKQVAASHGHKVANKDDIKEVLHSILPPVTPAELAKEEEAILKSLLSHEKNTADAIDEDDFVKSIVQNSYWRDAGDIVVKELMYFDSVSDRKVEHKSVLCLDTIGIFCTVWVFITLLHPSQHSFMTAWYHC
jgi:hypothetical protein